MRRARAKGPGTVLDAVGPERPTFLEMITPTNPNTHPRREFGTGQRLDRVLIGAAIGWGVVILILAIIYPIESINTGRPGVQPMRSLVAVHGYGVLPAAAIPLLIAIVVGLLHVTRRPVRAGATVVVGVHRGGAGVRRRRCRRYRAALGDLIHEYERAA